MQPALIKRMASIARSQNQSRNIASGSRTPTRTPAKTTSRTERIAARTPAEAIAKTPVTTPISTLKGPIYRLPAEKLLLYADRGLIVVNKPNGLISQLSDPYDTETVCFSPTFCEVCSDASGIAHRSRTSTRISSRRSSRVCACFRRPSNQEITTHDQRTDLGRKLAVKEPLRPLHRLDKVCPSTPHLLSSPPSALGSQPITYSSDSQQQARWPSPGTRRAHATSRTSSGRDRSRRRTSRSPSATRPRSPTRTA